MRWIEKHFDTIEVHRHNEALKELQLDEQSLLDAKIYEGWTGSQLYEKVRDMETLPDLKEQMYREQGGVCCYCGMKLEYPFNPQYRVEHVLPKESHRELVGEYKNILLSCRTNKDEIELRSKAHKKDRNKLIHCDEAKGAKELNYSPLEKSCEVAFGYGLDGSICPKDEYASEDVKTLGLDGPYLTRRRKNAIESLFIDDSLLTEEFLTAYKEGLQIRNSEGKYAEFYFVLIDVISQFLPAV